MTLSLIRSSEQFRFMTRGLLGAAGVAGAPGKDGAAYVGAQERPGDQPTLFSAALAGAGKDLSPVSVGTVVYTADGAVRRVTGSTLVATIPDFAVEAGKVYSARWSVRRAVETDDPLNDAVDFGIAWLDAAKEVISVNVSFFRGSLSIFDGLKTITSTFSRDQAATVTAPAGTRYARPYVQTYGANGQTDIVVIDIGSSDGLPGPKGDTGDVTPAAQAARDEAVSAVTAVNFRIYQTQSAAAAASIPTGILAIGTQSFAATGDGGGAVYSRGTVQPSHPFAFQSADGAWWTDVRKPMVIFASGQSNMANRPALNWTIPLNLAIWDHDQTKLSTYVGTGFSRPTGTVISTGLSMAAEAARRNPGRLIYLIDIAVGGRAISNWGPTPPDYNFRQAISGNVPPALAAANASKFDVFAWWQGESDASNNNNNYITDFNGVDAWLQTNGWKKEETPTALFGLSPYTTFSDGTPTTVYSNFNGYIAGAAAGRPGTRTFVDVGSVIGAFYWDNTGTLPNIHMTAAGYQKAGILGFNTLDFGLTRSPVENLVTNPTTGNVAWGRKADGTTYLPSSVIEYKFGRDQPDITNFQFSNDSVAAGAGINHQYVAGPNILTFQIYGVAAGNLHRMTWGGAAEFEFAANGGASSSFAISAAGAKRIRVKNDGMLLLPQTAAPAAMVNGELSIERTSNTVLTFRMQGNDGVLRSATITLA